VNIGDSYGGSGNASGHTKDTKNLGYKTLEMGATQGNQKTTRRYAKCLLDIPYRFSLEMINRGWIKRNTIIWHKPNCMPSSANDRFTVDFEYLFFFTKNNKAIFWTNEKTSACVDRKPLGTKGIENKDWEWRKDNKGKLKKYSLWSGHDYWFEQQFEEWTDKREGDIKRAIEGHKKYKGKYLNKNKKGSFAFSESKIVGCPEQGRNKRCVWIITTKPFPEAHFAIYPEGLIETPIKAGCPEFVCKKCGKARVKIYEKGNLITSGPNKMAIKPRGFAQNKMIIQNLPKDPYGDMPRRELKELGYSDCGCNAGFEPGIVLDLFMGAGTTALVALKQRKRFIGIEIKKEYIDMANKRIAKVQQEIF